MTDKVQKIRNYLADMANADGAVTVVAKAIKKKILPYVDSLQKELVSSIWHNGCEIPKSETNILMFRKDEEDSNYPPIAGCFHGVNSRLDGRNWGYYNGFCYNEIEPPVKWAYIDDILNLSNVERIGKNWKELVSEDLEKAARKYAGIPEDSPHDLKYCVQDKKAKYDAVLYGANWQEEKLTKEVKEAQVILTRITKATLAPSLSSVILDDSFKEGDKVKVIIIKQK